MTIKEDIDAIEMVLNSFENKPVYYFDIDGTIAETKGTDYKNSKPIYKVIDKINEYYDSGYHVVYWTARGTRTGIDCEELTEKQLQAWGCKYHELKMEKPVFFYVGDDCENIAQWMKEK